MKLDNAGADMSPCSVPSHLDMKSVPLSSLRTLGLKSTVFKKLHNNRLHEKMSHVARKPDFLFANNKDEDQSVYPRSLIGAFVIIC